MSELDSIMSALQQAKSAQDRVPQLESELWQANREKDQYATSLANREEAILRYKHEIESLQERVRKAEADRDDAEMRFLELDDKVSKSVSHLDSILSMAQGIRTVLAPPPPPTPVQEASQKPMEGFPGNPVPGTEGQSAPHPTASATQTEELHSATGSGSSEHVSSERPNEAPRAEEAHSYMPEFGGDRPHSSEPIHHDPEPTRYDLSGYTRQEWWDWNDRQMRRA